MLGNLCKRNVLRLMPVLEKVLIPQYAVDSKCSGVRMTKFVNFTNLFPCITFLVYGIFIYTGIKIDHPWDLMS